jgi:SpoVK/Ycf46/Vps4 family AAA+-type ATPase
MDDIKRLSTDLVHIARLALAARPQDVQLFVRRLAKRYREITPGLGEQLAELLRESPTRESPLRRDFATSVPVDADSRLQLVRIDHGQALDIEPIWSQDVERGLNQLVEERRHHRELSDANLAPTRTVIFTGPPGVGKTLAARWLAFKIGKPLAVLDLSAVMSSFLGRTGTNLRYVLDYAKSVDCILLLDELDAVAKRRDDTHEIGELKRLVTVLLQEIDDWPATGLLLAATNHSELLDRAVWRRFEMKIQFPMPNTTQVRTAIATFLGSSAHLSEHWIEVLSLLLAGSSFNDIEREITTARRDAVVRGQALEVSVQNILRSRIDQVPRSERGKAAALLLSAGLSQRQAHELTGVSRDTIRKAIRAEPSTQPSGGVQ